MEMKAVLAASFLCQVFLCAALPYCEYVKGINYGGRFIPESWMHLPGMAELYAEVQPIECHPWPCVVSACDLATQIPDAGARMLKYLNASIKEEHFKAMKASGFNVVRLPLGFWNLAKLYPVQGGPAPNVERWNKLGDLLDPADYLPYIERVMDFAQNNGLRVLLDLHGAPGGQSTNQDTGCASSCQAAKCGVDDYYFMDKFNLATGVQAVLRMAELCQAWGNTCWGIELLNEPSPFLTAQSIFKLRPILVDFYKAAIAAARGPGGLDPAVPIVLMDFPWFLASSWNLLYGPMLDQVEGHGTIIWETHIYAPPGEQITSLEMLVDGIKGGVNEQMLLVETFAALYPGQMIFLGEYALDQLTDTIPLKAAAEVYYDRGITHSALQGADSMIGVAVWNFDGPGSWGALEWDAGSNPKHLNRTFWKDLNAKVTTGRSGASGCGDV